MIWWGEAIGSGASPNLPYTPGDCVGTVLRTGVRSAFPAAIALSTEALAHLRTGMQAQDTARSSQPCTHSPKNPAAPRCPTLCDHGLEAALQICRDGKGSLTRC